MAGLFVSPDPEAIKVAIKDSTFIDVARRLLYQPVFTGPDELKASMRRYEEDTGPKMEAAFPPSKK